MIQRLRLGQGSPLNMFRLFSSAMVCCMVLGLLSGRQGKGWHARADETHISMPKRGSEGAPAALLGAGSQLYERVSPAVVGIVCSERAARQRKDFEYFGTGTIIDPRGVVLTSTTVVPPKARRIRVYVRGGRVAEASWILSNEELELSVIRIEDTGARATRFPFIPLGDSQQVVVGDPAFSLGNAFHSIEEDDQVSLSEGIVSGNFELTERRGQSTYVGLALETSAPINSGMDGGPLLDRDGKLIGLLSLNYSRSRWLGTAVPVHLLKPALSSMGGWFDDSLQQCSVYAGFELEEMGGSQIRVRRVSPDGPAALAGLVEGAIITHISGNELTSLDAVREFFQEARPGARLELRTLREGKSFHRMVTLWGRF